MIELRFLTYNLKQINSKPSTFIGRNIQFHTHPCEKLRILELEGISANAGMNFFLKVGYVSGNYNARRNLDRWKTMQRRKPLCSELSKPLIQNHTL